MKTRMLIGPNTQEACSMHARDTLTRETKRILMVLALAIAVLAPQWLLAAVPAVDNASGAMNVLSVSAELTGTLTSTGGVPTQAAVYWGETDGGTSFGSWGHAADLGTNAVGPLSLVATNLAPNRTYYYRFYATNLSGQAWASATTNFQTRFSAGPAFVALGEAAHFTLLAGTTITYPGSGTVIGDIGVHPGGGASTLVPASAVTGIVYSRDPGYTLGASLIDNGLLNTAKIDLDAAYLYAAGLPAGVGPMLNPGGTPGHIGGMNLAPGIYTFDTSVDAYIDGADLTLTGGPDDVWVFQMGRALTVEAGVNRSVILAGGAQAKNVFWQVSSSATLGTYSDFKGTIMAYASVILDVGSRLEGRALARTAQVVFGGSSANLPAEAPAVSNVTLTVISEHGVGTPLAGLPPEGIVYTNAYNSLLLNSITSPDQNGGTQYVNTGWSMIGNVPLSGNTNTMGMVHTNDAVLTWLWNTNYFLSLTAVNGSITNATEGWKPADAAYVLYPAPATGYVFDHWAVNGVNLGSMVPLNVTMAGAQNAIAFFTPVFADVTEQVVWTVDWAFDPRQGFFLGTLTLTTTNTAKRLLAPFWFEVQNTEFHWLRSPTGVDTNTTLHYLDISAAINAQLSGIGNRDLALDPGESVTVSGIELMGRRTPAGLVIAVWADPPGPGGDSVGTGADSGVVGAPSGGVVAVGASPLSKTFAGTALERTLPEAFAGAAQVTVRGLPAGLKYNAATGTITGVPTKAGTFAVVISAAGVPAQTLTLTVDALPVWAQGAFNGYIAGGGLASMTVSPQGKVTGKLVVDGKNYAFKAASFAAGGSAEEGFPIAAEAQVGTSALPLTLRVRQAAVPAPQTLGVASGQIGGTQVTLYRDVWQATGATLAPLIGYYTATLPGNGEYGSGYLTLTVNKTGKVKVAGKLADRTAVSQSGTLLLDGDGRVFTVLNASPKTYLGGGLFGLAEFVKPEDGPMIMRPLDAPPVWTSLDPKATGEAGRGFSRELGLIGGWYDKLGQLDLYYRTRALSLHANAQTPPSGLGTDSGASVGWDADGIALTVLADTAAVPGNTLGLKFTLARRTGLFKGSFKPLSGDAAAPAPKTVLFEGVLTPERADKEDGVAGRGFFLWADRASDPQGTLAPYSFRWSYDVKMLQTEPAKAGGLK